MNFNPFMFEIVIARGSERRIASTVQLKKEYEEMYNAQGVPYLCGLVLDDERAINGHGVPLSLITIRERAQTLAGFLKLTLRDETLKEEAAACCSSQ